MDAFDIFNVPVEMDMAQMLFLFVAFFLFGMSFLIGVILTRGYQLKTEWLTWNLAGATAAIVLFGIALGIFVLGMLLSPGYVAITVGSEFWDMYITMVIIGFVVAMINTTFLMYTKRGGL
jgi:hypothetical protein